MTTNKQERINACIWGGAVGDAWGAPLERATRSQITERFGSPGLDHLLPNPIITDDTQKLLFTIEAMLMGDRTD
ncbi:ADP-ribosylglycohydrolase family protein, partial [Salmonella enterica]|uniref:ADP-ribosylglycohydrolase family protein n=1 Tax=Salmonella enterica TaxID=28901 RepID=UPI003D29E79A